jgi:choline-sulfatase
MKENMPMSAPKDRKGPFLRRGIITLLYTLLIFASLPVFPGIWNALSHLFPDLLKKATFALVPLLTLVFFAWSIFVRRNRDPLFYVWSALFLFAYGPLVYYYCEYPAERFHLVEYGLLVVLTFWCLGARMRTLWIYPCVILYTFSVGVADETIQYVLPNRVYEFKDVTINWASTFLAAGLVAGITWRKFTRVPSQKRVRRWAVVFMALMVAGQAVFFYQKYWRPPLNVILLTVDSLRPDHLGCYGYERDTTPSLDAIARRGMIFKNVIASAPWTSPGLISTFTGLYPSLHGVQARGRSLLPGTPNIFKEFRKHGFRVPNISYLTDIINFSNLGLEPKEPHDFSEASNPGDELLGWIEAHHRSSFLVWYHYRFLHLPYDPGDGYDLFLTEQMKARLQSEAVRKVGKETVIPHGSTAFSPEEQATVQALYDGQLRELDSFIGRLYGTLNRWNLHRNTLLVITADHGEELFEHGFIGHASTAVHATMYDEVLKIPLILYAPSRFRGGRVLEKQVRQVDIMPTILDILGLPIPEAIHGVSLLPRIRGMEEERPLPAISESVWGGYQSSAEQAEIMLRSLRTDAFKLVCTAAQGRESCRLFDLRNDPEEKRDLFSKENRTALALKERLHSAVAEMQARRLALLSKEKVQYTLADVPKGAILAKPVILSPGDRDAIRLDREGGVVTIRWTGDKNLTYVIEYDVGRGWRNLKGTIPGQGTRKVFGPLPREAWEPLPYWNPYRIRVSPYGLEEYWSDWIEFSIEPP